MPSRFEYERAIRHSELPAPARHLALTIATWADAKTGLIPDRFQPSLNTLSAATGMNRATVKRHLKTLADTGWTVRQVRRQEGRQDNDITRTILTIPAGAESEQEAEVGAQSAHPLGAQSAHPGRTEHPGVGAQNTQGGRTERPKSSVSTRSAGSTPSSPASGTTKKPTNGTLFDIDLPDEPVTARTLIAKWIDAIGYTPVNEIVQRMGRKCKTLLEKGADPDLLLEAMLRWSQGSYARTPEGVASILDKVMAERANVVKMPGRPNNFRGGTRDDDIADAEYWRNQTDEDLENIL